jgi:hypothetical protein
MPLPRRRDEDDEPPAAPGTPGAPGWGRFSKSGYSGGTKDPGSAKPKPWRRTADPAESSELPDPSDPSRAPPSGGSTPGKAGWSKLKPGEKRDEKRGDDRSGPSAGWDKLKH